MDLIEIMALIFMAFAVIVILLMLEELKKIGKQEAKEEFGNDLSHELKRCAGVLEHPNIEQEMEEAERNANNKSYEAPILPLEVDVDTLFFAKYYKEFYKDVQKMHKLRKSGQDSDYISKETAIKYSDNVRLLAEKARLQYGRLTDENIVRTTLKCDSTAHCKSAMFFFLFWAKEKGFNTTTYEKYMREVSMTLKRNLYKLYEYQYGKDRA